MIKKVSWTVVSNIVTALVKWIMLMTIAKWLTPHDVGIYALALAVTSPLILFANMKLRALYVNANQAHYYAYSMARNLVASSVMLLIVLLAFGLYRDAWLIIVLVALSKALELVSDLMYALAHRAQDMARLSQQIVIKQLFLLVLFVAALFWQHDLTVALVIQVMGQVFYLGIETKLFVRHYSFERTVSWPLMWSILALGLPLGLTQFVLSFNTFLPRYALELFSTPAILGYFSAIAYVTVIANILMGAISQNYLSIFKQLDVAQNYEKMQHVFYKELLAVAVFLCVVLAMASVFLGQWLLEIIYTPDYATYAWLLPLFCICIFFNALNWNLDTLFISVGIIKKQLLFAVMTTAFSTPLTLFFVYMWDIAGAAWAMGLNSAILYLTKELYFRKWLQKRRAFHEATD